ncbi:XRE family transcriptional regulator [Actinomadura rubrisoli]|uniref:XRE family transcriptional regulator n=2 Tax=Actinomadura rubrisoli TaxID=2530368 RepID=A0A4R5BI29_9ACTN|nr:XRE family transcriptional regulator [Actinomadura rubrisoli]
MAQRHRRHMEQRRRQMIADLVALRKSDGLSQTEVAARMGTSQSAVARLESGHGDVRASTLERYAAAIDRSITWRVNP